MTTHEEKEIYPTLKVNPKDSDELAVQFEECQITIVSIASDIKTKFGDKVIAVVQKDDENFCVFVNQTSINNLVKAFGRNDEKWIGKICDLKQEKNERFDNEMIVFYPVSAKK